MASGVGKTVHAVAKTAFDQNAALYDAVRPSYISAAVDKVIEVGKLRAGSKVLDLAAGNTADRQRRALKI